MSWELAALAAMLVLPAAMLLSLLLVLGMIVVGLSEAHHA